MSSLEQEDSPKPAPKLMKVVAGELARLREHLTRIQALLQQHPASRSPHPPSPAENQPDPAVCPLVQGALGCITKALTSMMEAAEGPPPRTPAVDASPISEEQPRKKRKIQAPRRNVYRRRASPYERRTKISKTVEDGYSWRKYGQKEIYGAKFSRNYFRCTHKHDRNCQAKRQVQQSEEDPSSYVITYLGEHTCMDPDLTCRSSPSSQGTCIIDFASAAAAVDADRQEAPPSSLVAAQMPEGGGEEISRGNFTAGSSSTPELQEFWPELCLAEEAGTSTMAMEKYFAGMTREECDVTSGFHCPGGGSLDLLEFSEIAEAGVVPDLDVDVFFSS